MSRERTLLVDADSIVYQLAFNNQSAIEWEPGEWTIHGNMEKAKIDLQDYVESLRERLKATHLVMALSDYDRPWRKEVLPSYKANRKAGIKPVLLKPLREYVTDKYETIQRQGLEGDDVLGILATVKSHPVLHGERIVMSLDKDMKTVPGLHCSLEGDTIVEIDEDEANWNHLCQTLTGDTVDGYKGCPGVGPERAWRILASADPDARWEACVSAYEEAGLTEADALVQARVARILRASDYDFKRHEVKLWEPHTATSALISSSVRSATSTKQSLRRQRISLKPRSRK
jgi:DNA polymerase I